MGHMPPLRLKSAISLKHRVQLAWSLVMSTLLYNVHVWSKFDGRARSMLNTMYNKVWRRVYGKPRHCRSDITDVGVRVELGVPSLDCYVRRRRLKYLTRVCRLDLPPLMALLQAPGQEQQRMPWSRLIISDLSVLYATLPRILGGLPPPEVDPEPFWQLVRDFPHQWRDIVSEYFTPHDDAMEPLVAGREHRNHAHNHVCDICERVAFRTEKALNQHKRIAHKCMSRVCDLVPDTSVCPVCHTDFVHRSRLISHLSDNRVRSKKRGTCCHHEFVKSLPPALSAAEKSRLRQENAAELRAARRQGHTHVIAVWPAVRGKRPQSADAVDMGSDQVTRRKRLRFKQPEAALYR